MYGVGIIKKRIRVVCYLIQVNGGKQRGISRGLTTYNRLDSFRLTLYPIES